MPAFSTWKQLAISSWLGLAALLGWGAMRVASTSPEYSLDGAYIFDPNATFNLAAHLRPPVTGSGARRAGFPYARYLDSANFSDCGQFQRDVRALDAAWPAAGEANTDVLFAAWTDSLARRLSHRSSPVSTPYLLTIARWANQFSVAAHLDSSHATAYAALNAYWMTYVSEHLRALYERDERIKYNFDFKYLNQLCLEAQQPVPMAFSRSEKVINNVAESRWSYLLTKLWRDSSICVKFVAGFSIAFLGVVLVLAYHGARVLLGKYHRRVLPQDVPATPP